MSVDQVPARWRLFSAALLALLCIALLALPALSFLTSDANYPKLAPRPPTVPALTNKLALVVVDGLRHDYATNPELAPNFSRNMREHSSGVVWAGQITMTSAAVLSFGTGTRGTFSQVVLNVEARRTTANHLFENLRARGLRGAVVGDPIWKQAYGAFDWELLSDSHLALDVDDTPELFAGATRMLAEGRQPELLVLHFFANDHLQHSHGVFSQAFREFFLRFDRDLQGLLERLPEDTTVIALSDHGALSNGNHGMDDELERKSPFFAYGPGIRPGVKLEIDQADLASTFAALLGVANPAHSVGAPVTSLLDVSPDVAARLDCQAAENVAAFAKVAGVSRFESAPALARCRAEEGPPSERSAGAVALTREWDRELVSIAASKGLRGLVWCLAVLTAFGAALPWVLGGRSLWSSARLAAALGLTATTCISLTAFVDASMQPWRESRAIVLWVTTVVLALLLLGERWFSRLHGRFPTLGLVVAPGFLFASFPTNTQLHTGIASCICFAAALLAARRGGLEPASLIRVGLLGALSLAVLMRLASERQDPLGVLVLGRESWLGPLFVTAGLAASAWLVRRDRGLRARLVELGAGLVVALACALPQRHTPVVLGLVALAALPIAAAAAWSRGLPVLGRALLLSAFLVISRPVEIPAVVAALVLADAVGFALQRAPDPPSEPRWFSRCDVLVVTVAFGCAYAVRVALGRGLDFGAMDWGVGTFDAKSVSHARVAIVLLAKYALAMALPVVALFSTLARAPARRALGLLALGLVLRLGTMAAVLFAPPVSFWSHFRMVGDLGPDLVMALCATVALVVLEWSQDRARRPVETALAS